jgi:hypothetical protein
MHDPDLGIAIEGYRAAHTEHLLATLDCPDASRTGKSWLERLGWTFNQTGPTGLYGLGNGLSLSIEDLSLGPPPSATLSRSREAGADQNP